MCKGLPKLQLGGKECILSTEDNDNSCIMLLVETFYYSTHRRASFQRDK